MKKGKKIGAILCVVGTIVAGTAMFIYSRKGR